MKGWKHKFTNFEKNKNKNRGACIGFIGIYSFPPNGGTKSFWIYEVDVSFKPILSAANRCHFCCSGLNICFIEFMNDKSIINQINLKINFSDENVKIDKTYSL